MKRSVRSSFPLRGDLQIDVKRADGSLLRRMGKRNQITYDGANSALFLWTQDTGVWSDWQFTKLVPGTSGVPPTAGDPGVGSPVGGADQIILSSANRPVRSEEHTSELQSRG